MSGLRERQKADRKQRILTAAEDLFRMHGYENTKIDAIAASAGVSVGTVYNYVENKSDLLMMLVTAHFDFVRDEVDELIRTPPENLVDGVANVFFAMTQHSLDHLGRDNWRHLFGLSIAHRQTVLGERFAQYNHFLLERIVKMLSAFQAKGMLPEPCDTHRLGGILFRIETMHYIELASSDDMSFEAYKESVRADLGFVLAPYTGSE